MSNGLDSRYEKGVREDMPDRIPPEVVVRKDEASADDTRYARFLISTASGQEIGFADIKLWKGKDECYIDNIELDENFQKKGYARAAYPILIQELVKEGFKLTSGTLLSPETQRTWDWLVTQGKARKLSSGVKYPQGWNTAEYEAI